MAGDIAGGKVYLGTRRLERLSREGDPFRTARLAVDCCENRRRTLYGETKVLINELALYVLRKSLLSENEALYLRAIRMYNTRNQLAHTGDLDEDDNEKTYKLDRDGSMAVLKTTLDSFSRLGERADFELPTRGFKWSIDSAIKEQRKTRRLGNLG